MGKGSRIPDRWEVYTAIGSVIKGTRFLPFKVPLKENISINMPSDERFTPAILIERMKSAAQLSRLGLVIDLTNTHRYYNPQEITKHNIQHAKIYTEGHNVPSIQVQQRFKEIVNAFLDENRENELLIGVHCTHGVNRTGYLVCRYMIDCLKMTPSQAIAAFNEGRGHVIERENYLHHLHNVSANTLSGERLPVEAAAAAHSDSGRRHTTYRQQTAHSTAGQWQSRYTQPALQGSGPQAYWQPEAWQQPLQERPPAWHEEEEAGWQHTYHAPPRQLPDDSFGTPAHVSRHGRAHQLKPYSRTMPAYHNVGGGMTGGNRNCAEPEHAMKIHGALAAVAATGTQPRTSAEYGAGRGHSVRRTSSYGSASHVGLHDADWQKEPRRRGGGPAWRANEGGRALPDRGAPPPRAEDGQRPRQGEELVAASRSVQLSISERPSAQHVLCTASRSGSDWQCRDSAVGPAGSSAATIPGYSPVVLSHASENTGKKGGTRGVHPAKR